MAMNTPHHMVSSSGENLVVLAQEDYEDLVDTLAAFKAAASFEASGRETVPDHEVDAFLAAPTPLAFWRKKRGLTQASLAKTVDTSQGYIADLEAGRRKGDILIIHKIAKALHLPMEALILEKG
jgi:DNA-binding XRE family transcriptional regulator